MSHSNENASENETKPKFQHRKFSAVVFRFTQCYRGPCLNVSTSLHVLLIVISTLNTKMEKDMVNRKTAFRIRTINAATNKIFSEQAGRPQH